MVKTLGVDVQTFFAGGGNHQCQYFRLDVERRAGLIFTHPFPHIHYVPGSEPRYSLNGWQSANAIMDFFEHVYLQCYHPTWLAWAEALWNKYWAGFVNPGPNPFRIIVEAFRESQFPTLEQYEDQLDQLKKLLRDKKDEAYRLRVEKSRCSILAYPC